VFASCIGSELEVASSDVLHEGVAADDDACGAVGLKAAHRSQPCFQPSVIALDPVVRVLVGVVDRVGHQLGDDVRQRGRPISDDHFWETVREQSAREEAAGRSDVATLRHEDVDDLAVFVDGAVDVAPRARDLHVSLVDEPASPDGVTAWSRRVDQRRREALHPPVQGDVIHVDPALSEELLEIAVRQPEAEGLCCVDGSHAIGEGAGVKRRRRSVPPFDLSAFVGFRFPPEVIVLAVRWYLRFGLSYRDLEELLAERGVDVDHVTLYRWVQRFTPALIDAARPCRHTVGRRWFVDETYVKVAGAWRYVYRAVDEHGQVIDVLVTDRSAALAHVIAELMPDAIHNTDQYANNWIECDHGRLKARLRPMRGLKTDRTASIIIRGHAFMQNLRRGHYELGADVMCAQLRVAAAFNELASTI
jgi:IS6 family transposase